MSKLDVFISWTNLNSRPWDVRRAFCAWNTENNWSAISVSYTSEARASEGDEREHRPETWRRRLKHKLSAVCDLAFVRYIFCEGKQIVCCVALPPEWRGGLHAFGTKRKETNGEIVDEVIVSFFGFSIASTGLLEVSVLHVSVLHTARAYIKPRAYCNTRNNKTIHKRPHNEKETA